MSWENRDWEKRESLYSGTEAPSIWYPHPDQRLDGEMARYLASRGLSYSVARSHMWYAACYHGPRIIVPCVRTDGKNFWQGRLIEDAWKTEGSCPFGLEPKRWDSPHGPRGDALCWLPTPGASTLVVVEGPMDALAAVGTKTGSSAIATLGVGAPGPVLAHVAMLAQGLQRILLIPDPDELKSWIKIQSALGSMGVATEIRLPWAKDLADMPPEQRQELISG